MAAKTDQQVKAMISRLPPEKGEKRDQYEARVSRALFVFEMSMGVKVPQRDISETDRKIGLEVAARGFYPQG